MSELIILVLLAILLPATVFDCRYHRIPNIISLSGWLIGPLLYLLLDSLPEFSSSLYGFILIFLLTFPLYALRWMGAGDVKLMAGVGAVVGIEYAPSVFMGIVITGAVMGILMLLYNRVLKNSFQRYGAMLGIGLTLKRPVYLAPDEQEQKIILPYALPITIGTFMSIGLTYINV